MTNDERCELNVLARKAHAELGRLHGPDVTLETMDGPTPYRAGDRVHSSRDDPGGRGFITARSRPSSA
jgi:hypothetical protein